jgi:hypothetical protein
MPGPADVSVVLQEGRNFIGTWENLVLAVWGQSPGAGAMRAIHQAHLDLLERHEKVGHLVLIHGMPQLPTPDARDLAGELNERSQMSSVAIVLDGEGFWASAARGFLTTVLFFQRSQAGSPTQLFKELDDAVAWQRRTLGHAAPDPGGAKRAVLRLQDLSFEAAVAAEVS